MSSSEKNKEQCKKYYQAHRAAVLAANKTYHEAHAEEISTYQREYQAAHREQGRTYTRRYYRKSPDVARASVAVRRARLRNAPVIEHISRQEVYERDQGRCHICGKKVDPQKWHLDHLVPLSKGGEHSMRNVAVAHPQCNLSRGATGPAQLRLS